MEGSFENMTRGYCDENWAQQERDPCYEEMQAEGKTGANLDEERKPSACVGARHTAGT